MPKMAGVTKFDMGECIYDGVPECGDTTHVECSNVSGDA